ncbi:uncharacterized protein [Periplaneta americana]|uniref:uncharacterized protein isoform X1 n=1 Tax=Periplaneta americana TaxID=6978 RepID=UPI0037E8D81F
MIKVTLVVALVLVSACAVLANGTTTAANTTAKPAGGKIVLNNFAEAKSPGLFQRISNGILSVFKSITSGIAGLFRPKGQVFHSAVEIVETKKPEVAGTTAKAGAATAKASETAAKTGGAAAKAGEATGNTTAAAAATPLVNATIPNLGLLGELLKPVKAEHKFKEDPYAFLKKLIGI